MSPCPRLTSPPAKTCARCCPDSWPPWTSPPFTSPTTATKHCPSAPTSPSELGPGTADRGTVSTGQLRLPGAAPPGTHGPVRIFYRPEDLLLGTPPDGTHAAASLTAPAAQILPTRPLARITLAADPPLTALVLHRDLQSLGPSPANRLR
jgi:hypothetical protein